MKPIIKERLKGMISGLIIGTLVVGGGVFAKQANATGLANQSQNPFAKDICTAKDGFSPSFLLKLLIVVVIILKVMLTFM